MISYIYFISYVHKGGVVGNAEITLKKPITSFEHIKKVEHYIFHILVIL